MHDSGTARRGLPTALIIAVVTMLTAVQPIATDFFLPALPSIRDELRAPVASVQLTLSVLMICFGVSQLFFGPAADRFGRRPVILFGLSLYAASSSICALAPTIEVLIVARGAQGIGMAAALVCSRALMRDLYEPQRGTHMMTKAMSLVSLISMTVPLLGALLATHFGWRATLAAPAVFALALLILVLMWIPETLPHIRRDALQVRPLLVTYAQIAREPTFLAWTSLNAFGYAAYFGFFSASSYLYIEYFKTSRLVFAMVISGASVSYLLGTFVCRRLIAEIGIRPAVRRAGWMPLIAAAMFIVPQVFGMHTSMTLALALWVHLFGYGILQPCAQVGLVSPFRQQAGAAAALGGFAFAAAAFASTALLGVTFTGDASSIAWTTGVLMAVCGLISQTLVQRLPLSATRAVPATLGTPNQ